MPAKCRHSDGSLWSVYISNNPLDRCYSVICSRCNRCCPEITYSQAISGEDIEFDQLPSYHQRPSSAKCESGAANADGPQPCSKSIFGEKWVRVAGRCSDTKSAVARDIREGTVTVSVPPCIHGTPMAGKLVERLLENKWEFHLHSDIDPALCVPLPKVGVRKMGRRMGLRSEPVRKCWACEAPCRTKCQRCLEAYYCSRACQKLQWKTHEGNCKEPTPAIKSDVCVAVPDYQCFFQYQQAYIAENDGTLVSIMIMSRGNFDAMFGSRSHLRTIANLALFGKPLLLAAKTFCGA